MAIKVNEVAAILKEQIRTHGKKVAQAEIGRIITIGDNIAQVSDLDDVKLYELLRFENGSLGIAFSLEEDSVSVILMSDMTGLSEGGRVERTGSVVAVPVGDALIGRVVDALGQPLDGKAAPRTTKTREILRIAPGVMTREEVTQPLETGILAIDAMIPIGRGQRELIIGDRQTGKTALAIDAIINQKGKNVLCVYVAIGQKNSTVAQIVEKLRQQGALEYTTIVVANASDAAPLQWMVPFTGITIAEEWMENGRDVLLVFDDLSKHAVAYRTVSLLVRRPPGREAYPGDVFFLHSQLLERAAKVNRANGGGSITALPIVETQAGDISAYIPTNVISITDGQIFTVTSLFNAGQRPAIDVGYSVSRVGSAAQIKAMRQVVGSLKLQLAVYNEMAAFAQFGSDLDISTKRILVHGKKVLEVLKQAQYAPLHQVDQTFILLALQSRITNPIPVEEMSRFKRELIQYFQKDAAARLYRDAIIREGAYTDLLREQVTYVIAEFAKRFLKSIINYVAKNHESMPDFAMPSSLLELTASVDLTPREELTTTAPTSELLPSPVISTVKKAPVRAARTSKQPSAKGAR